MHTDSVSLEGLLHEEIHLQLLHAKELPKVFGG